jgi:tetratricopeptide (TPR) repeat protein
MRGLMLERRGTPSSTIDALQQFGKAIELDPTFGVAYAKAAHMHFLLQERFHRPLSKQQCMEAMQWAEQALELASDDDFAVSRAAVVLGQIGGNYERAAELAHRSVILNPNSSIAWNTRGWMDLAIGEPARALDDFARATRLNPIDPDMIPMLLMGNSAACSYLGRHEEGTEWVKKALTQRPTHLYGWINLAINTAFAGRAAEAREAAARLKELYPSISSTYIKQALPLRRPEYKAMFDKAVDSLGLPE